jgi:uncharacterized membrane protein
MSGPDAPGKGWYWVAGALALGSTLGAVALVIWLVLSLGSGEQFLAPGRLAINVEQPGKVVIWLDHRTVFQGRSYDAPDKLPAGARIRVIEEASGRELDVGATFGASSASGNSRRVSVAQFRAGQPGRHLILVEGTFDPRVFSAGADFLARMLWAIFGAVALVLVGWGLAIGLFAWVFIRREAGLPAASGAGQASASLKTLAAVVYGLQLAGFLVGFTPLVGVILNYVKRPEARGTWLESHFSWQIRTFWWSLLWFAVGLALAIVLIGFFIMLAAGIWVLYRAIRGWVELTDNKPIGV